MSVADLHDLELVWPNPGPTDVIVTGTFDQWSSSIHLVKGDAGFSGTVKVPWGEKVAYKFIVDGHWQCRDDRPQENDGHGNINNVIQVPERPASSAIQESLARLFIPPEVTVEGYNDAEMMVTAVEFMPHVEPPVGISLPPPTPEVAVEGSRPGAAPSTDAPLSEQTLDISEEIATSTTSVTLDVSSPPLVPILPVDDGSTSPPMEHQVNGNAEAHPSHSFATHAPVQFSKGETGTVPAPADPATTEPETAKEAVPAAVGPARVNGDVTPIPVPVSVPETSARESETKTGTNVETTVNGHHRQSSAPPSVARSPSPSTPSSNLSTATHKKRRSLLAKIRHIFDKDKDKQKAKEKSKA